MQQVVRPSARITEVKAGDFIFCDQRFDCGIAGKTVEVKRNIGGLFVNCECGQHYLEGNVADDGENYIGYYKATEEEIKTVSNVIELHRKRKA